MKYVLLFIALQFSLSLDGQVKTNTGRSVKKHTTGTPSITGTWYIKSINIFNEKTLVDTNSSFDKNSLFFFHPKGSYMCMLYDKKTDSTEYSYGTYKLQMPLLITIGNAYTITYTVTAFTSKKLELSYRVVVNNNEPRTLVIALIR